MLNEIDTEILREIKELEIYCPDCRFIDDDQYFCTTCSWEGGDGKINVYSWLETYFKRERDER